MHEHYAKYGNQGLFLKCDIRHFFGGIDHDVLKRKLQPLFADKRITDMLFMIIDSYHSLPGKGLPLGNQTSQWFALWYLDSVDRYVKEQCRIKHYTRYMDDFIIIHSEKKVLQDIKKNLEQLLLDQLQLECNAKTQIIPIKNGVEYLGWRFI